MNQNERGWSRSNETTPNKSNIFIEQERRRAAEKPTADADVPTTGYEWIRWARQQEVHLPAARHLLLLLASYADERGVCWPGMKKLSAQMGLSPRRVRKLSEILIGAALLHVEHTPRKPNGRRGQNRYTLMPNRGMQATGGHLRPGVAESTEPGDPGDRNRGIQASRELPEEKNCYLNDQPTRASARKATKEGDALSRSPASAGANGTTSTSTSAASERRGMQRAGGRHDPPVSAEADGTPASILPEMLAIIGEEENVLTRVLDSRRSHPELADDDEFAKAIFGIVREGDIGLSSIPDARLRRCVGDYLGEVMK